MKIKKIWVGLLVLLVLMSQSQLVNALQNGWSVEDGKYVYYQNGIKAKSVWIFEKDKWYFINASGYMESFSWSTVNWAVDGVGKSGTFYFDKDGSMKTGWFRDNQNIWSYTRADGSLYTGWQMWGKDWYYIDNSWMATDRVINWKQKNYYVLSDGRMATSFFKIDGISELTFFAYKNGVLEEDSNWVLVDGDWYYILNSAMAVSREIKSVNSDKVYYVLADGRMARSWFQVGNDWKYANDNGVVLKRGWVSHKGHWYFIDDVMQAKSWVFDDSKWYYLSEEGKMVADDWVCHKDHWYYVAKNGSMKTGWHHDGSYWYWLDQSSGEMASNITLKIDGTYYSFDAKGRWIR